MIKVERNGDELCWTSEKKGWIFGSSKREFRMKVKLTPD
jgi:hypothetical protein